MIRLVEIIAIITYICFSFIYFNIPFKDETVTFKKLLFRSIFFTFIVISFMSYLYLKYSMIIALFVQILSLVSIFLGYIYFLLKKYNYINSFKEFLYYKTWAKKVEEDSASN